jgi:hypothetical protein
MTAKATKLVLKHEGTEKGQVIGPLYKQLADNTSERYYKDGRWSSLSEAEAIGKKHKLPVEVF